MNKESILVSVLNALKKHDVQTAVLELSKTNVPQSAAWIGMGVMFVVGEDEEYTDTLEQFRSELEKAF